MTSYESLVYPIQKLIKWTVVDISNLEEARYSESVKIGNCEWRLQVKRECSEETEYQSYLSVFWRCSTTFEKTTAVGAEYIISLKNQSSSSVGDKTEEPISARFRESAELNGFHKLIEWSQLLSDGYVKDDSIVLESEISITFEENVKTRVINFNQKRPNNTDLQCILSQKNDFPITNKNLVQGVAKTNYDEKSNITTFDKHKFLKTDKVELTVDVSQLSFKSFHTDTFLVNGLPAKLSIQHRKNYDETYLASYIYLNWEDQSDWWRCLAIHEIRIINQNENNTHEFCKSTDVFRKHVNNFGSHTLLKLDELHDKSNRYVVDGKLKFHVLLCILETHGFDDMARKGIEIPFKSMTDCVLSVNDQKFYVCQKILAQQSSYFDALFKSNPDRSKFTLSNIDSDEFLHFLNIIHNVDADVNEENLEKVLDLIERFKAPECFKKCDIIMENKQITNPETVLPLLEKYSLSRLAKRLLWTLHVEAEDNDNVRLKDFSYQSHLTDIGLKVDFCRFYASKQILANSSLFFLEKFYSPLSNNEKEVILHNVTAESFQLLLNHIYHPTTTINNAKVELLMQMAIQFSVPFLMEKCEKFLVMSDSIGYNEKLEHAVKYNLQYLKSFCAKDTMNFNKLVISKPMSEQALPPKVELKSIENVQNLDTFDSLVYPIEKHFLWEVENILDLSLDHTRNSEILRIGKCDWRLSITRESSESTNFIDGLRFDVSCLRKFETGDLIEMERIVVLKNQHHLNADLIDRSCNPFRKVADKIGFPKLITWSKLLTDGFVTNNTICFYCKFILKSEESIRNRNIDYERERPNNADLRDMLQPLKIPTVERIEKELEIAPFVNHKSRWLTMHGIPIGMNLSAVKVDNVTWLGAFCYVNETDQSDWWRCKVSYEFRVMNQMRLGEYVSKKSVNLFEKRTHNFGFNCVIKMDDLADLSKGYVQDGKFKVQMILRILEISGFDEKTNRGIEIPMVKMSDCVLVVNDQQFNVCKKILAQQSQFFNGLFRTNPNRLKFTLSDVKTDDCLAFLDLVHNVDANISEENLEGVLALIHKFKAPECLKKCDLIMMSKQISSVENIVPLIEKYQLPRLAERLRWALNVEFSTKEPYYITDFLMATDMTDIEIEIDACIYFASKQILANASKFFMEKFYYPSDNHRRRIKLDDVPADQFYLLLNHIYHPTTSVTDDNVHNLLRWAHYFSASSILEKCEHFLITNDEIEVIDKLEYSGNYNLHFLLQVCMKLLKNSEILDRVTSHAKYLYLSPNVLKEMKERGLLCQNKQ